MMDSLVLKIQCEKCGETYTFGEDALVTPWDQVASSFSFGNPGGGGTPDLVGRAAAWHELRDEVVARQRAAVDRITQEVAGGGSRQWTCRGCNNVQTYKPL